MGLNRTRRRGRGGQRGDKGRCGTYLGSSTSQSNTEGSSETLLLSNLLLVVEGGGDLRGEEGDASMSVRAVKRGGGERVLTVRGMRTRLLGRKEAIV